MMIDSNNQQLTIYESPDGGKTVYSRKSGEAVRQLESRLTDPTWLKEKELTERWASLKQAVFMDDSTINDLIEKIEVLMKLKK
jgi:hypothetical protein